MADSTNRNKSHGRPGAAILSAKRTASNLVEKLGAFRNVLAGISPPQSSSSTSPETVLSADGGEMSRKDRISATIGAGVNKHYQPIFEAKGHLPNFPFRCHRLSAAGILGRRKQTEVSASWEMPTVFGHPNCTGSLEAAFQACPHEIPIEDRRGPFQSSGIYFNIKENTGTHKITISSVHRRCHDERDRWCWRRGWDRDGEQSTKNSIKYAFTFVNLKPFISKRGGASTFEDGSASRHSAEIAGFWGNEHFLRLTSGIRFSRSLASEKIGNWNLDLRGGCGLLLARAKSDTFLHDRFFVGGSSGCQGLRGFAPCGVGPAASSYVKLLTSEDGECCDAQPAVTHTGGDTFGSGEATLSFQIPNPKLQGLRLFAFLSGAALVDSTSYSLRPLENAIRHTSVTTGVGLAVPLTGGCLEVSLSHPLKKSAHDITETLQLGIQLRIPGV